MYLTTTRRFRAFFGRQVGQDGVLELVSSGSRVGLGCVYFCPRPTTGLSGPFRIIILTIHPPAFRTLNTV